MNVTQLHGRVKTSIFSPPPSAAGFLGIWDLGSILVLSPGHSEPLLESTVQVGAGTKTSKNEFGGVKNLIFWPLLRALPQLRELRRKNFANRSKNFTATSQQLHSNFT